MTHPGERSNVRKYRNPNPVHQWLLRRFLQAVTLQTERALGPGASPRLLDVGCGEGYVLRRLLKALPGLIAQGIDGSREALSAAHVFAPGAMLGHADATRLPFRDQCFDIVVCLEVLEHLPNPSEALEELRRVSRRHVLISVPNQPFFAMSNLLRGQNMTRLGEDPEHLHHWTAMQFVSLVKQGLRVVSVHYPFPWVLVLAERV